jgi:hypothetical protein
MRRSLQLSLAAVFGALHVVLYFVSFGLWRNWGIYLETVEGVILGPGIGFMAAFVGSSAARFLRPDPLWMFGIVAEPFSVMTAGLLSRARWKPALALYLVMLSAYFIQPYGRALPIWTILDVLAAFFILYPAARLSHNLFEEDAKNLPGTLVLISFITVATDSLVRIFLLVPCGLYSQFFDSYGSLQLAFTGAAVSSYVEDGIAVLVSLVVGVPVLMCTLKLKILGDPNR